MPSSVREELEERKKTTYFYKNLSNLDFKEKKDYLDDLIGSLMLLKISEDMFSLLLKYQK
jgi:hypothetical protein